MRLANVHASDLSVFLLEGPRLPPPPEPEAQQMQAAATTPDTMSITKAWQSFIMPASAAQPPPRKRLCDRTAVPPDTLTDEKISVRFRHPPEAVPPPRLAAFALPAQLYPELLDSPRDVCFCLTQADGKQLHGSALQLCDAEEDGQLVLRSLVLLSKFPVFELWHTMLHTIYSRRESLWPASAPVSPGGRCRFPTAMSATARPEASPPPPLPSPANAVHAEPPASAPAPADTANEEAGSAGAGATGDLPRGVGTTSASPTLSSLLERTADVLQNGEQELEWLTSHPLWLPTPLAPLFKALRWQPAEVAYLIGAILTDQKVLLHSEDAHKLYMSTCALKALITPLEYSAVFIPLLPQHLMSAEEASVLLGDCSTPYLIGCETALLHSLGGGLPCHAAVVDLDAGSVRHAPSTEWFDARRPPFTSLISELQRCMGAGSAFKPLRTQAACLRFVVDLLNIKTGFLALSKAPADADALSRVALLERMADEASCRCQQQHGTTLGDAALAALKQAMHQSLGAMLAGVCAESSARHGVPCANDPSANPATHLASKPSSTEAVGGVGGVIAQGLALGDALMGDGSSSSDSTPSCCGALSHMYAAQPFREWWSDPSVRRSPERLQWLQFRQKRIDLLEFTRENHKSLKVCLSRAWSTLAPSPSHATRHPRCQLQVLEQSLEERLHSIWGGDDGDAAEAELGGGGSGRPAAGPVVVSY